MIQVLVNIFWHRKLVHTGIEAGNSTIGQLDWGRVHVRLRYHLPHLPHLLLQLLLHLLQLMWRHLGGQAHLRHAKYVLAHAPGMRQGREGKHVACRRSRLVALFRLLLPASTTRDAVVIPLPGLPPPLPVSQSFALFGITSRLIVKSIGRLAVYRNKVVLLLVPTIHCVDRLKSNFWCTSQPSHGPRSSHHPGSHGSHGPRGPPDPFLPSGSHYQPASGVCDGPGGRAGSIVRVPLHAVRDRAPRPSAAAIVAALLSERF